MKSKGRSYDSIYGGFDSPLARGLRQEAYGRDIGQHSWVTVEELEEHIGKLHLEDRSRILDLGCGPGGPLTFIVRHVRCRGKGLDLSQEAVVSARRRAAKMGLGRRVTFHKTDLNRPLPYEEDSFNAVVSYDVMVHLEDRAQMFKEVRRVVVTRGRFLFTDAGVITGMISNEEILARSIHGKTQFVPAGFNEKLLGSAGFRLIDQRDQTASLLKNATGRLAARRAHQAELERTEGHAAFEREQQYLETVVMLAKKRALLRVMYLAEAR